MAQIFYEKKSVISRIRNPLKNFEETEDVIEIRTDPLLGLTTRVLTPKNLDPTQENEQLQAFVEQPATCFFCEGRLDRQTPMFPENVYEAGRIRVGEAVLFPNLSGYGHFSGVCILSKKHFTGLESMNSAMLYNALKACQIFFRTCGQHVDAPPFPSLNWNYLLPAGSSLLHPHMQPILDPVPTNLHRLLLEKSRAYKKEKGSSFWTDLKDTERAGPRVLFETSDVFWFAPFAPLGFNECDAIIGNGESIDNLSPACLHSLADGIITVLHFFHSEKRNSFNLTLFSPPMKEPSPEPCMPCLLKIVSRPVFSPYYRNDATFFERLHLESVIDRSPEDVAATFREMHPET